jgi:glycosyltransferase involved in cell wall biosynthesis
MPLGQAPEAPADVLAREREALTAVDIVVVTSEWTGRWLRDAYRLDRARIRVAVPGADPAPVAAGSTTGRRLLVVGPVSYAKGHDTLIAALDRRSHLDWRLDCVGSLRVDADTAGRMRTWAAATGRVHLRGPLAGADLQRAYASADLLVHPSRFETYGMVVTEALARGIPVLASDVGGTREAVGTVDGLGPPGLLVPPADADALAAELTAWLTDAQLRRSLRAAALVRRNGLPSWAHTVSVVDEALRSGALEGARR